ncbi:MAG: hypothetical protein IBX71_00155 [Candidatus Desulforudis sp.]|nr:hypothetical protein [Desulforudis sp.]
MKRKDHNLVRRDEKRKTQAYVVGATPEAAKELRLQQEKQSPFSQSRHWNRTEVGSPEQKAVLEQIHAGLEAVGNKLGLLEALQKKVDELGVIEKKSPGPDVLDERLKQLDRIEQKLDAAENKLAQLETTIARELKRPDVIAKMRGELENADIETEKRESRSGLIGWLTGQDRRTGD